MQGNVTGLGGVLIWTSRPRFEALRRFYVDELGLVPRSDRPGFVNFEWGTEPATVRLTVAIHAQVEGEARDPLRVMVNMTVDDIDAAHRRLSGAGVPCLRPPSPERWRGVVATYLDPDGNVVQLLQLPPPAAGPGPRSPTP